MQQSLPVPNQSLPVPNLAGDQKPRSKSEGGKATRRHAGARYSVCDDGPF